jgi:hypothetical protein
MAFIEEFDADSIVYSPGIPGFGDLYRKCDAAFVRRIYYVKYVWGVVCLSAAFVVPVDVYLLVLFAVYVGGAISLHVYMRRRRIGRTPKPTRADIVAWLANFYPRWLTIVMPGLGGLMTVAALIGIAIAIGKSDFNGIAAGIAGIVFFGGITWLAWYTLKRGQTSRPS